MLRNLFFFLLLLWLIVLIPSGADVRAQGDDTLPLAVGETVTGEISDSPITYAFTLSKQSSLTFTWRSDAILSLILQDSSGGILYSSLLNPEFVELTGGMFSFGPLLGLGSGDYRLVVEALTQYSAEYILTLTATPFEFNITDVGGFSSMMRVENVACTETDIYFVLVPDPVGALENRQIITVETTGNAAIRNVVPLPMPIDVAEVAVGGLVLEIGKEVAGEVLKEVIPFAGLLLSLPELVANVQEAIENNEGLDGFTEFSIASESPGGIDPNLRFLVWATRPTADAGGVNFRAQWAGVEWEFDETANVTGPTVPPGLADTLAFEGSICDGINATTGTPGASAPDTGMGGDDGGTAAADGTGSTGTETANNDVFTRAEEGVARNADWEPYIEEIDGVPMALVPVGCFQMGSNERSEEQPVHTQCIEEPFWIDVYEVTNEQYGSTGCESYSSDPDQPRNCVDWFDAQAFCEARGARLPTEAEWEYAARGPDSLIYPWGNDYDAALVIGADDPTYGNTETAPVGSRPDGASWVGALDLSGNVWEWTSTVYEDYPYNAEDGREINNSSSARVLRGGSFVVTAYLLRSALRADWYLGDSDLSLGFRCARS